MGLNSLRTCGGRGAVRALRQQESQGRSMRVLLTGGAGSIGSHIVAALVSNGHEPVVLDALLPTLRDVDTSADARLVAAEAPGTCRCETSCFIPTSACGPARLRTVCRIVPRPPAPG